MNIMGIKERFYIINIMNTWGFLMITDTSKAESTFSDTLVTLTTNLLNNYIKENAVAIATAFIFDYSIELSRYSISSSSSFFCLSLTMKKAVRAAESAATAAMIPIINPNLLLFFIMCSSKLDIL